MKNARSLNTLLALLLFGFLSPYTITAQDAPMTEDTGLPGENFSLEGALDLFQQAQSPEQFEELLNAADNKVNNLDLNEDGEVDYIRVEDHQEGDVHAIVLQVPIDQKEAQDIAVIEIEKQGAENALLQIIGDEDIYGEQVIVEPVEETAVPSKKGGPSGEINITRVVVNVWYWPSVRFIYQPTYRVYVSPFRWGYYPKYWKPWKPYPRNAFRSRVVYHPNYRVVTTHRVVRAHRVYAPRRSHSVVVHKKTTSRVAANPRRKAGARTTTTTVVKGKNGNTVARRKTTKTAHRKR